ncbi:MAG: protein kinase, partial [Planctomycetes bacterium]|nr:protein kinase [Planctomycetota bacterium]
EIRGVLGRGGMGVVYRARQKGLNRQVALKMILAGDHAGAEHVARFKTEAEAVAQLQHPNIVQIFDIGESKGLPFFSLEFIDGPSLEAERGGKPMQPRRAAELIVTLARAMHYAHQRGIVHRDLKPANVLLTSDGMPKVTDFGLVKRVEANSSETRTGTIVGTPSYMAPEQAWGKTDVGPLADIYALGAMLYALVTGRPPFQGPTPLETVMQLRQQEPVPPSRLQPTLPRDLETICMKALQKEPHSRYESAEALAEDLERYLNDEPIVARPIGRMERTWRWCRRNPSLSIAGGVALVLALCLMIGGPAAAALVYDQKQQAVRERNRANDNARIARENEALAKENERRAIENGALAEKNAGLARGQRDLALTALNTLVERAQNDLQTLPQSQPVREKLLLTAMDGLDKIADTGTGPSADLVMARAHRTMGDVLLETGLAEQAHGQYVKTHEIVLLMTRTPDPNKPYNSHLNLGRSYVNLGKAAQRMGDAPKARGYFEQSLRERETALPMHPDPLFVKQELSDSYGHLARISLALGRPDEALVYNSKGLELRREWLQKAPQNIPALREFSGAQLELAGIAINRGKLDAAIETYTETLKALEQVRAADPGLLSGRGNVAFVHNQLGVAHLLADRPQKARDEYQQAVELLKAVAADDPNDASVQRMLGTAYYGLATAVLEAGDGEAARTHFETSRDIRRRLAEKDKDDLTLQADLMLALARCGEHAEAAGIAGDLEQRAPKDASLLYQVAGGYALAAAAAASDKAAAAQYSRQAIGALQKAVAEGYRSVALIEIDPDLDPVRGEEAFQKLVDGLKQPAADAETAGRD